MRNSILSHKTEDITVVLPTPSYYFFSDEMKKANCAISVHAKGIRDLLLRIKSSTVQSGILQQLTDFKCTVTKTFKWTAMCQDLSRFEKLYDALSNMTTIDRSVVSFDTSTAFRTTNRKFLAQANAIAQLHGKLQTHGLPRHKGQQMINKVVQVISENAMNSQHVMSGCDFKIEHSQLNNKVGVH